MQCNKGGYVKTKKVKELIDVFFAFIFLGSLIITPFYLIYLGSSRNNECKQKALELGYPDFTISEGNRCYGINEKEAKYLGEIE